jgi:hypothetical protein
VERKAGIKGTRFAFIASSNWDLRHTPPKFYRHYNVCRLEILSKLKNLDGVSRPSAAYRLDTLDREDCCASRAIQLQELLVVSYRYRSKIEAGPDMSQKELKPIGPARAHDALKIYPFLRV